MARWIGGGRVPATMTTVLCAAIGGCGGTGTKPGDDDGAGGGGLVGPGGSGGMGGTPGTGGDGATGGGPDGCSLPDARVDVRLVRPGGEELVSFGPPGSFLECGVIPNWSPPNGGLYGRPAANTYHPRLDIDFFAATAPGTYDGYSPVENPMAPVDWGFTYHENPDLNGGDTVTTNWQASSMDCVLVVEQLGPDACGTFHCSDMVSGPCGANGCAFEMPPGSVDALDGAFRCPWNE